MRYNVTVEDRRGKYARRSYTVEATQVFLAEGEAVDMFIRDSGHPPYRAGQSMSAYYRRFWAVAKPVAA